MFQDICRYGNCSTLVEKENKMKTNIEQLEDASIAYYFGTPIMTDAEFDSAIAKLRKDDPDHPLLKRIGAPVPGTKKVKHKILMGSLSNANNEEEFVNWIPEGESYICLSHKLDGSSLELIYDNGHFVQAITRGDGEVGEDVTKNVLRSSNVSLSIDPAITSVRCECLIHKDDWNEHFKGDANPRNSAAGTLRRHDSKNVKYLRFYAFDALVDISAKYYSAVPDAYGSECGLLDLLDEWFLIPEYVWDSNQHSLMEWCKVCERIRDNLEYEIDGVVAKIDDRAKSKAMGIRDGRPKGQIAIKFKPRGGETILRKVVWQVGHTGALTPVGEVDPVGVGGTTIRRVTLCNMNEIDRLGIAIDDTVEIVRAGDVIPKLSKLVRKGKWRAMILPPDECPECKCTPFRDGAKLFCPNNKCPGRYFSQVMNWIKKRNILNIGSGLVASANIKYIRQLYEMSLEEWTNVGVGNGELGIKRAKKVMDSLEKSKYVSLSDFIGSLGIKGVGRSLAADLCNSFDRLTLRDITKMTRREIAKHEKFGIIRADDFCGWLLQHSDEVMYLGSLMYLGYDVKKDGVFSNETICFTGKSPKTRSEMSKLAENAGASVSSSVNGSTTILVISDINGMSNKAINARSKGIQLMTSADFLALCV